MSEPQTKEVLFKEVAKYETWGNFSGFTYLGIKILVAGVELTEEEQGTVNKYVEAIQRDIFKSKEENHPDNIKERQKTIEDLKACFPSPIYYKVISNKYWGESHYGFTTPWLIVTTTRGPITIGWRKRVIVIDWSGSDIENSADSLFSQEDVTRGDKMIHAYGYDKAREYISKLMTTETKGLLPVP
jgi:hypothetical protein